MIRKFKLLSSRFENLEGTTVYLCQKSDYGLCRDDEWATGEQHLAVTLKSDGDYPFFTVPRNALEELPS